MSGKFIINVCTMVELGSMLVLAGIGLKRNNDCYKAEMELIRTKVENDLKDIKIAVLERELEQLKYKNEAEES